MLLLLPPSETKRPGGRGRGVRIETLVLPSLAEPRHAVIAALEQLSADGATARRVLGLSHAQDHLAAVNGRLRDSPTMAAVDRNTGVLYDALDASSLDAHARRWLRGNVLIHTAVFGPVGALDLIPEYRLSAGTSLPGIPPLRRVWADAVTRALAETGARFIVDLRSEAYRALGPVPAGISSVYIRVVADGPDGTTRALNHFNKHAKGAFVRALAVGRPRAATEGGLLSWAQTAGIVLRPGTARGEVELVAQPR